jgi:hypothetical protein
MCIFRPVARATPSQSRGGQPVSGFLCLTGGVQSNYLSPYSSDVALAAGRLPPEHRDPWDRIIAMQAMTNGWLVITSDSAIAALGAKTLW